MKRDRWWLKRTILSSTNRSFTKTTSSSPPLYAALAAKPPPPPPSTLRLSIAAKKKDDQQQNKQETKKRHSVLPSATPNKHEHKREKRSDTTNKNKVIRPLAPKTQDVGVCQPWFTRLMFFFQVKHAPQSGQAETRWKNKLKKPSKNKAATVTDNENNEEVKTWAAREFI